MKNLQRYLQDAANARRQELLPYVFHVTGARVQTGPFKGTALIPRYMWGDGDTAAKLLGVYEDELHDFIEHAIARQPDVVINIGCAEGYYALGMARRLPAVPVMAVDIDARAAAIVQDTAYANQVSNVRPLTHLVDADWIESQCAAFDRPFLILDCEGAEIDLLNPEQVSDLAKCSILVESHDCINAVITATLTQRFSHTHDVRQVSQTTKDAYQFDFLHGLSDCDKWALVHEGRPSTMTWLYMTPR